MEPQSVLAHFLEGAAVCDVSSGEHLAREGVTGRQTFIVLAGRATVSIGTTVVGSVEAGDVVGAGAALRCRPASATVTAVTPMSVLVVGPRAYALLLDHLLDHQRSNTAGWR